MSCNFPVGTYRSDGTPTHRPCGYCIGCRLEYSRQWAVRCCHEAFLYEKNCFITLTYNNENLPEDGSVYKSEITKFIKKLRKKVEPNKIRFFACGEYGGTGTKRPHYHICLFNYDFPDKNIIRAGSYKLSDRKARKGNINRLYSSEMLQETWEKGFTTLGELTFESAAYVARYCVKKINGEKAEKHYEGKNPEFALMSRMPGIGKEFYEKYKTDIYPKGFITLKGVKQKAPKYYDNLFEKIDKKTFEELKRKREKFMNKKEKVYGSLVGYHREKYRKKVTKRLERNI